MRPVLDISFFFIPQMEMKSSQYQICGLHSISRPDHQLNAVSYLSHYLGSEQSSLNWRGLLGAGCTVCNVYTCSLKVSVCRPLSIINRLKSLSPRFWALSSNGVIGGSAQVISQGQTLMPSICNNLIGDQTVILGICTEIIGCQDADVMHMR